MNADVLKHLEAIANAPWPLTMSLELLQCQIKGEPVPEKLQSQILSYCLGVSTIMQTMAKSLLGNAEDTPEDIVKKLLEGGTG